MHRRTERLGYKIQDTSEGNWDGIDKADILWEKTSALGHLVLGWLSSLQLEFHRSLRFRWRVTRLHRRHNGVYWLEQRERRELRMVLKDAEHGLVAFAPFVLRFSLGVLGLRTYLSEVRSYSYYFARLRML